MKVSICTQENEVSIGLDVGSTTAKIAVVRGGEVVYECYERHYSMVREKSLELLSRVREYVGDASVSFAVSGSAGLGLSKAANIPFVQEVYATSETVRMTEPDTSVVIELGGEDAKIIFFDGGLDERMNGTCAGGTGAFIDQMATLLDITPDELDTLSLSATRIYPIASRCGVFAKTDIQPLLNQGASKENIAASIYQAVVNQTIAGLAQGRKIKGKVMFLGGPLWYCMGLRARFVETLQLGENEAIFPSFARISVALGAAVYAARQNERFTYEELLSRLEQAKNAGGDETVRFAPLFASEEEYAAFRARHEKASVPTVSPEETSGKVYLGIDCGSTTTKVALIDEQDRLLWSYYHSNRGNPVPLVKEQLQKVRALCGDRLTLAGTAVTGYGEDLIRHAFHIDTGLVETIAHFTAARHFCPDVDFILDIGGQDMKCFRIRDGAIDSILLNEACSSGCGSFIETFARALGYEADEFARLAIRSQSPVHLGTRCTVFMNSSVKQAQKDGAKVEDIAAGLAMSVVRNAIYKVIRASSAEELGQHIVVQGGTFLNDAVLRSFERELGRDVIRPQIAGLMGAFGAALAAKALGLETSGCLSNEELAAFTHTSRPAVCGLCGNHCQLTVNTFSDGERYISGNKCERGAGKRDSDFVLPDLVRFKRDLLSALPEGEGTRGTIGLPLALGMYELAPLWNALFRALGYRVVLSGFSSRALYAKGQYSIPSDTACYPAKMMHGHIEELLNRKVDAIFYPCLTYNIDEHISANHYNCPVVAYYSEVLQANMEDLSETIFLYPYLNINDEEELARSLAKYLTEHLHKVTYKEVRRAVRAGFTAYEAHMDAIRKEGERALAFAQESGHRALLLCGRPYHIDPEIGHGIDQLATSLGFVVVTEDAVPLYKEPIRVHVLNQWTYHARLYNAAVYAGEHENTELVQLVSFGCGVDAITTDEVRDLLTQRGKLYTQIKIDEITNLGAVRIRLRSLLGALEEREAKKRAE